MIEAPYDEVYDAIVHYLGDGSVENPGQWNHDLAKLYYENTLFGPPPGDIAAWVKVVLDTEMYDQESIGADDGETNENRWDESGTVWFHVFTARGISSREARRIGKALANAFRGKRFLDDTLHFRGADLGAGDPGEENAGYYLLSVSIEWYREEAS